MVSERWFVGIDLAWSARNPSGYAVLRGEGAGFEFVVAESVHDLEDMAQRIRALPGDWMVAIDAPLIVRNQEGMRSSDRELSALYRRFEAGALPTNLTLLGGVVRGGDLVRALAGDGLRVVGELPPARLRGRWAFESYPHAGMVELFGLDRTIKYKRGRVSQKRRGLAELTDLLRTRLAKLEPPLAIDDGLAALLDTNLADLRGSALKAQEDKLDALFCSYLAGYLWRWGRKRHRLLGSAPDGAVVVPRVRDDVAAVSLIDL